VIDPQLKSAIEDILNQRAKVARVNEEIKEAVKAVAERFDLKPAQLNKVIGLVEKERDKGGVLDAERSILDIAADF
jgi:CRISPR/Cas system Type II protein with McrA/HNH and RuvC-like nuclease domain